MNKVVRDYVSVEDVKLMNEALSNGEDVRVQLTPTGIRIIADKVRVIKKKSVE